MPEAIHTTAHAATCAGELINLAAADSECTEERSSLAKFLRGEPAESMPPDMEELPERFILEEHLPHLLKGLDPDSPVPLVEAVEGVEWFPDISLSHAGMEYQCNDYQALSCLVPTLPYHPIVMHSYLLLFLHSCMR